MKKGDEVICIDFTKLTKAGLMMLKSKDVFTITDIDFGVFYDRSGNPLTTFKLKGIEGDWNSIRFEKPNKSISSKLVEELKDNPEWVEVVPEPMEKIFTLTEDF